MADQAHTHGSDSRPNESAGGPLQHQGHEYHREGRRKPNHEGAEPHGKDCQAEHKHSARRTPAVVSGTATTTGRDRLGSLQPDSKQFSTCSQSQCCRCWGESLILLRQSAPRLLRDVDQHLQVGANHRAGSDLGEAAGTGPLARSHAESTHKRVGRGREISLR
jgi:hypothetical protein